MNLKTLFILLFCCCLTACSTFKIYQPGEKEASKGIPFYTQKNVIEQTTTLTRSWIDADITHAVLVDNKLDPESKQTFNFKFNIKKFNINEIKNQLEGMKDEINNTPNCYINNCIQTKMSELKSALIAKGSVISSEVFINESAMDFVNNLNKTNSSALLQQVVSNTFETKTVIDYSQTHYFNTKIYPFTKSNTQFTLSDKGTLTTASNDVDTTGLADVIPLNDFLTDKLGLEEEAVIDDATDSTDTETLSPEKLNKLFDRFSKIMAVTNPKKKKDIKHQLTIETELKSLVYTIKKTHDSLKCSGSESCRPLSLNTPGASVTRKSKEKVKEPEKKEDDKSYQFSGKFTPPKK